ncbi:MAG: glycosyltransferase family 4 protein [bacterium]
MKKNVCMIVYNIYHKDQRVRREAEALATLPGYSVTVLTLKTNTVARRYYLDGVRVVEINISKYYGKGTFKYMLSYIKFLLLSFVMCTWLFILRQIDIVHVHNMPNFLVLAGIVPRLLGKKVILDIHDLVPELFIVKFKKPSSILFKLFCFEELISCTLANRIICSNHIQRDILVQRKIPLGKITICMNMPDNKRFNKKYIKSDNKIKDGKFKMVYHGTVTERLGVDLSIRSVACLTKKIHNLEFYIWGYGDDYGNFVRLAKELNIQDRVYFNKEGFPLERLPSELCRMDLGIIGNRENIATEMMLPVKLLENIALGIPVVAPRLKILEYYFSNDMVCYFEPENVDSMACAILKLYNDESLRKMQADKAKAFLDQYGWEKHKIGLIQLYKTL